MFRLDDGADSHFTAGFMIFFTLAGCAALPLLSHGGELSSPMAVDVSAWKVVVRS